MKLFVTDFGADRNLIDGVVLDMLRFVPRFSSHQVVDNINNADVIILVHAWRSGYVFQQPSTENKPIVVMDYLETGWHGIDPHFIGLHCVDEVKKYPEYVKLNTFLESIQSQIKVYFKRECFIERPAIPVPVYPVEYLAYHPWFFNVPEVDSFEKFHQRPYHVSFIWGLSNPSRPILHGEMMKSYGGDRLCVNEMMLDRNSRTDKIALLWMPDYMRMPFEKMMGIFQQSKIVISMWGCGQKCFRDAEAPFNSVMAIQESLHHWAYPWNHHVNCIVLPNVILENGIRQINEKVAIERMNHYLDRPKELYELYLAGRENADNYRVDNYLKSYVIPTIARHI